MRMRLSRTTYWEHMAPIMAAVLERTPPDQMVGYSWSPSDTKPWGLTISRQTPRDGLWMAAGWADARKLYDLGVRRLVYVEHGAGAVYPGDPRSAGHGAYSGGAGLDHVELFVCPRQEVADRWLARYPNARTAVVGCPRLDVWHKSPGESARIRHRTPLEGVTALQRPPVVAVTFHHDQAMIPEQASAWTHYRDALPVLRDWVTAAGGVLLGHSHPRTWRQMRNYWRSIGVPCTDDLNEVMATADVLVGDTTSAVYEFASTGRPIVWLSAPWYRRDVHHGGRFWADVEGLPHVEDPGDLIDGVIRALADPVEDFRARVGMVERTYAYTDGRAAERAAEAVLSLHGD